MSRESLEYLMFASCLLINKLVSSHVFSSSPSDSLLFCFLWRETSYLTYLHISFPFSALASRKNRFLCFVCIESGSQEEGEKKVETETLSLKEKKPEAATKREILNFMKNLLVSHQRRGEKFAESLEVKERQEDWLFLLVLFLSRTLSINWWKNYLC